jgi:3-hydroxyisobutyrate dehydrogenase
MNGPRRDTIAVVGVGNMGGGMAQNLLSRGWLLRVHDIDRTRVDGLARRGAVPCASAAEAASTAALTLVCVVDAGQCDAVLFGAGGVGSREGGLAGHTVMLCPTIAPDDTERIASRLQSLGASTIDAPMSGGPARAADGSMSLMVACDDALFHQHQALIEALSSKVFRVGARVGDGARTKLVNNLLAGINLVGAAEALVVAQRMGLDVHRMLDVIEQSSGQSWIGSDRMRRALAGDYAPRAHVTLLEKDTGLALRAAQAVGLQGPLGAAAHAVFVRTHEAGMADLDDAAVFRWLGEAMRSSR